MHLKKAFLISLLFLSATSLAIWFGGFRVSGQATVSSGEDQFIEIVSDLNIIDNEPVLTTLIEQFEGNPAKTYSCILTTDLLSTDEACNYQQNVDVSYSLRLDHTGANPTIGDLIPIQENGAVIVEIPGVVSPDALTLRFIAQRHSNSCPLTGTYEMTCSLLP